VCAALDHRTLVHDDNTVGANDTRETVRNDERRTTDHQALQGFLNEGFILRIDARQGFVEEEDGGILEQCTGNRQTLALSTGET
jgi:hypothetical protein